MHTCSHSKGEAAAEKVLVHVLQYRLKKAVYVASFAWFRLATLVRACVCVCVCVCVCGVVCMCKCVDAYVHM
jgi:hypothetical protein